MQSKSDTQSRIAGFMLVCLAVPAAYAGGLGWYAATFGPTGVGAVKLIDPWTLALLGGLPLFVSSLGKWWDVWIKPSPKLGAPGQAISPPDYSFGVVRNHVVIACVCVAVHLAYNQIAVDEAVDREDNLPTNIASARTELAGLESKIADRSARLARLEAAPKPEPAFGGSFEEYVAETKSQADRVEFERRAVDDLKYQKDKLEASIRGREDELKTVRTRNAADADAPASLVYYILMGSIVATSLARPKASGRREGQRIGTGAAA